jgi:hypothetical protein
MQVGMRSASLISLVGYVVTEQRGTNRGCILLWDCDEHERHICSRAIDSHSIGRSFAWERPGLMRAFASGSCY